ncbi:putative MFS family arabinose efflux permease [Tamaricihabitans halophyticus]|uniref:Putative MFS family arabinose efflux permease n=1 Tax=Tamaricihabitans halophyticus TaxID=1262583 RepID=A0A4R2R214_9PSEU|nr:MFS transporter [Tamaricihabitans halophyticus]TCP56553.1 putative MFS family arabinose efflux permease [Tamaricihabitans halophyticus]
MRSGSADQPGDKPGKSRAGKRKRKWIPEAGQEGTTSSGSAAPRRARQPDPTLVDRPPAAPNQGPPRQPPARPPRRQPPPDYYDPPTDPVPIGEAPTGAIPSPPRRPLGQGVPPGRRDSSEDEHYGPHGYAGEPGEPQPDEPGEGGQGPTVPRMPKKLTVTRVAALRSRELAGRAVDAFHRAHKADGADRSGLTSLSWSVMLNYASDAAMAVALANVLFFSPTDTESSKGKIALYLFITIAPFALVAPVIGPALDRIQRGRRLAMAVASAGQAIACLVMALNFDAWLLYPAALAKMVLSKSFTVLKSAVTPRVVPPDITLSKTNARLTVFGLAAGGVFGAVAAGIGQLFGDAGAMWFTAAICAVGAVQAMRIPSWVEVTEGEVPTSMGTDTAPGKTKGSKPKRQPLGRQITISLWANGTIRLLTGFLMMFAAFVVKDETVGQPMTQLLLLGLIAGAAGLGGFVGNGIGARLQFGKPDQVVIGCVIATLCATTIAAILQGAATAAVVGLIGSTSSALAKISLDAVVQNELPEQSRASAFGRSETVLQLAWVIGGAVGLLLPTEYWVGFLTISAMLAIGLTQTLLVRSGRSLLPSTGKLARPDTTQGMRAAAHADPGQPPRGRPPGPRAPRGRGGR